MGIDAYRVAALQQIAMLPPSRLETVEKLEQLRALSNGIDIYVAEACEAIGDWRVNTPEDLERVGSLLKAKSMR